MRNSTQVLLGKRFIDGLLEAGVVRAEDQATRVIIDAPATGPVRLYVELLGDDRVLSLVLPTTGMAVTTLDNVEPSAETPTEAGR